MKPLRITENCFRLLAILQLLTGFIAIVPLDWIAFWHHWLGLGTMPDDATLRYALRGGGFVQAAIGVLIWIIASDLPRYYTLAVAAAAIYLIGGPAFYLIDRVNGMPLFWCQFDGLSCFSTGAILLWLCKLSFPTIQQSPQTA